jgi:hypothetical protein
VPELVWFTAVGLRVWHAGYGDRLEALCGAEVSAPAPFVASLSGHYTPPSPCVDCANRHMRMVRLVETEIEASAKTAMARRISRLRG